MKVNLDARLVSSISLLCLQSEIRLCLPYLQHYYSKVLKSNQPILKMMSKIKRKLKRCSKKVISQVKLTHIHALVSEIAALARPVLVGTRNSLISL